MRKTDIVHVETENYAEGSQQTHAIIAKSQTIL